MKNEGVDKMMEEKDESKGEKFEKMDMIGMKKKVIVGKRGVEDGEVEVKERKKGERKRMGIKEEIKMLKEKE